uniref:HAT C-terminal dimerisation domain-containing protein n=1 Tax=Parascaris univalens TaxID=6257 RepID=A0A915AQQ7_PARUN
MSISATASGAPEAKKFRLSLPTQVVVERPVFTISQSASISDTSGDLRSPNEPLPLPSSASMIKEENEDAGVCGDDLKPLLTNGQSLVDVLSTAMMFQANALLKQQQQQQQQQHHHQRGHHHRAPKSITPNGSGTPTIPGALAVAASPAAALFGEDDWSWHRNPAAAIRSGGTNKQTPVWKYFVYNKAENLSRCIVGDCTYMLKGPHTSTLACHLKKHPAEYAEFQKLKLDYTRDRNGGQLPSSPVSSTSGSGSGNGTNSIRAKSACSSYVIKTNKLCDSPNGVLNLSKQQSPGVTTSRQSTHSMSSILNVLNARANAAALAGGNGHLVSSPISTLLNQENNSNINNTADVPTSIQKSLQNPLLKSGGFLGEKFVNFLGANVITTGNVTTSRKWGRDDRKQKEMETKLALMLSATQLPTTIIENSFFREFMEFVQPKFSVPHDTAYIEEIINTQHSRMLLNVKNQLSASKKVAIMVDVLKLTTPSSSASSSTDDKESKDAYSKDSDNSDSGFEISSDENQSLPGSPRATHDEARSIIRLCVSAAYFSSLTQRTEVALLGIRTLSDESNIVDSLRITVEQVLSEFDIPPEKISRYLTNGVVQLVNSESSFEDEIFPRMLEPYNQKLTQSLLKIIDASETIEELKKSFYCMILNFVTRQDAMELLQQVAGRVISLPITDSFLVLTDAVLELKDAFLSVCAQLAVDIPIEPISEEQWQMLEGVSRLLRLFRTHMNVIQDGAYATIDGVVPSLMQLQLSLDKDFSMLGDLAAQLKEDLRCRTSSILDMSSPDFDGSFIEATALNHHLVLLLDDEQIAYAKGAIERQLNERMQLAEEVAARRSMKLNGCVDALLAAVVDRNGSSPNSSSLSTSSSLEGTLSPVIVPSSALYPDLVMAANERRKVMKERQQNDGKNRYAKAIVQSYFDELVCGGNQPMCNRSLPLGHAIPTALNGRQLPPLQFWQLNATKCAQLSEIAIELLTIPSSTVSLERIFASSFFDFTDAAISSSSSLSLSPSSSVHASSSLSSQQPIFDPISLLNSIDDPQRIERDVMLRFNRSLIPKV